MSENSRIHKLVPAGIEHAYELLNYSIYVFLKTYRLCLKMTLGHFLINANSVFARYFMKEAELWRILKHI